MQAYDLLMLIVIGMATIFGAIKGFAWQVASLASVIVSYIVAYRFRFEVAEMIQAKPPWNQFLAMLILYVGTSFVIWVGFRLLSGAIDRVRLKEFDRHLGAGFGFAKGLLYCLLITMFAMSLLGPRQQSAICQSRSGYYISVALDRGVGVLPKEIHDVVEPYLTGLDDKLNSHDGHDHGPDGVSSQESEAPPTWGGVAGGVADAAREQIGQFGQQLGQQLGNEFSQQVGERLGMDPGGFDPRSGQPQTGEFPGGANNTFPNTGYQSAAPNQGQPGFNTNGSYSGGVYPNSQPRYGQQPTGYGQPGNAPFPGTGPAGAGPARVAQPGSGVPSTGYQR